MSLNGRLEGQQPSVLATSERTRVRFLGQPQLQGLQRGSPLLDLHRKHVVGLASHRGLGIPREHPSTLWLSFHTSYLQSLASCCFKKVTWPTGWLPSGQEALAPWGYALLTGAMAGSGLGHHMERLPAPPAPRSPDDCPVAQRLAMWFFL